MEHVMTRLMNCNGFAASCGPLVETV